MSGVTPLLLKRPWLIIPSVSSTLHMDYGSGGKITTFTILQSPILIYDHIIFRMIDGGLWLWPIFSIYHKCHFNVWLDFISDFYSFLKKVYIWWDLNLKFVCVLIWDISTVWRADGQFQFRQKSINDYTQRVIFGMWNP